MKKQWVIVDNSKAPDVRSGRIRPLIKNVECELVRIVQGETFSLDTLVVLYKGEEVYLWRHEIK